MANAINNIGLITRYSTEAWDLVYKQESVTALLRPAVAPRWVGAKTVRVPKSQLGGLSNYYRNNNYANAGDPRVANPANAPAGVFVGAADFGYQKSPAQVTWEEYTVAMDRAAAYQIEQFDNEEVDGAVVGQVVTEVSRTQIIPEVDAYRLSKIASYALASGTVHEDITTAPLAALNAGIAYLDKHAVPEQNQIVYVSPDFMSALRNTQEVTKVLLQDDYRDEFNVKFKITKYEGRPLIMANPDRFRTEFVALEGGYTFAETSVPINFMCIDRTAVCPVVKYDKVQIVDGLANLAGRGFNGYTIFARVYHDIFVFDNKRVGIYVSLPTTGTTPTMELDIRFEDDGTNYTITNLTWYPGEKWGFVCTLNSAKSVGATIDLATDVAAYTHVGDVITETTTFYFVGIGVSGGTEVLATFTKTIA